MSFVSVISKFPSWVPRRSWQVKVLLLCTALSTGSVLGYDASLMNSFNIMWQYNDYFHLTSATTGLNSGIIWVGGTVGGLAYAKIPDVIGRKPSIFYAGVVAIIGGVLTALAQDVAMFLVARFVLGIGIGATYVVIPTYIAEMLPIGERAIGLGLINDTYYVGGLLSSGISYGTASLNSTMAWRVPALCQIGFTVLSLIALPFAPESPRWLAYKNRKDEALIAIAQVNSDGDVSNPSAKLQCVQILETIAYEREIETPSIKDICIKRPLRKRFLLVLSVAIFSMMSGCNIFSYYLGTALTNAGITNSTTQLQVNIILNAFCLVVSLVGTYFSDRLGRRMMALSSTALCTAALFVIGALTKEYGNSTNTSAEYANVAMMFLAQGFYSFGWTPLLQLYPPEILNYQIRSIGMAWSCCLQNCALLIPIFAFPVAMDSIGWITYIMNGAWNIFEIVIIAKYWVETRNLSLEEIDALFDGEVHSSFSGVKQIIDGKDPNGAGNVLAHVDQDLQDAMNKKD